jgi:acyl transferase domain-containing protein/acyl carrier protein
MPDQRSTAAWLTQAVADLLGTPPGDVPADVPFTGLGLSSLQALDLTDRLQRRAGVELSPTAAYDHPTIDDLCAHVAALAGPDREAVPHAAAHPAPLPAPSYGGAEPTAIETAIAIVGIGCRVPGAEGPEGFWRLLAEGVDAIGEVPADRWDADAFYDPDTAVPDRMNTRWGGFLDDVEGFDADFHGVSAREAARMDPQQRLALDAAWEALEDAGIAADGLSGSRTGVFMGVSTFDHGTAMWGSLEGVQPYDGTGGALSIVANRLSYNLNLRGPSMVVDTACSSSLVAVHLACQALRAGEADLALAGGVNVITSPRIALSFSRGGLMAADGRCKPFDHRADGYVRSEGVGVVVLKPLARALADGDRVYAVVRGGAVNQDGRTNGLTAPNGAAQEAVVRAAWTAARLPGAAVGYVEAHGTGTQVGDPIEVAALAGALGADRPADRPLLIGSVKSNVGHLEAAAGVVGLIKTALSLYHGRIPATVHYEKPNPLLGLDRVPVAVVAAERDWPTAADGAPAPAGVSSFGFGGTNAHVVVTAAPDRHAGAGADTAPGDAPGNALPRLVPVSARSAAALARRAGAWAAEARTRTGEPGWLDRAGAAAALRTEHGRHRAAVVAADPAELAAALTAVAAAEPFAGAAGPRETARRAPKVAFVFPGQGSQWAGMGRRLAATVPVFRAAVREADAAIARYLGRSLWSDEDGLVVEGTAAVQPALFATQVALAATLRSWGLEPDGVIGHSMGEIAAAHAAGALSLDDAARVVCERSRLLTELSGLGGLALVELAEQDAARLIEGREHELSIAAINGPRATVLSGSAAALEETLDELARRGVFARRIAVEFAAHSPQVEPLQPRLREALAPLAPRDARCGLYSTVTGDPVAGAELGPGYWVTNVRAPVRFGPTLARMVEDGYDAFVEIAPHPVLARPVEDHLAAVGRGDALVVSCLRRGEDELRSLLGTAGSLHTAGVRIDWRALYPGTAAHTCLPRHGWERRRFPITRLPAPHAAGAPPATAPGSGDGPQLGARIRVGVDPTLQVWDLPLTPQAAPELADHVVEGVALVAGAYWFTAAAQGAAAASRARAVTLHEVAFAQPCPLDRDRHTALQLGIRPDGGDRRRFAVTSWPPAGPPLTHAAGLIGDAAHDALPDPVEALAELRERCPEEVPVERHYERLRRAGLQYGPRFRGISALFAGSGRALARVRLAPGLAAGAPLHPALLDACLQTVAAATGATGSPEALPLPVGADRVWARLDGAALREGWCHARVVRADEAGIVADVAVLDDSGAPVWTAAGLRLHLTRPRRGVEEGRLYTVRWEPYTPAAAAAPAGSWLLLADEASTPLAQALRGRLADAGAHCVLADPDQTEHAADLLAAAARQTPLRGVVDLRATGPDTDQDAAAALQRRGTAALLLAQAVTGGTGPDAAPRLWLFTAGTQAAGAARIPDPSAAPPAGAALWGLGRTVENEHPESGCTLVDLPVDPGVSVPGRDLAAVTALLLAAEPPAQAAVRDGAVAVPVLAEARDLSGAAPALRADRTYVITGGLGALGLRVARRLADRGAGRLLLLGRGAPSAAADQQIRDLISDGCDVRVASADLADAHRLGAALLGAPGPDRGHRPIGGVVHLAGVLEDALLPDVTAQALARSAAGKAVGAWNLHRLTRDEPVEFFVLFSSLAGLIGTPGQSAYAAANTFLDALAGHRAALGLPGQSIAWGVWGGQSLAGTAGGADRLAARGVPPMDPDTALALFDEALRSPHPHLAAAAFAPADLLRAGVWPAARGLLAPLLPQDGTARRAPGGILDELAALDSDAQRHRAMAVFLAEQVRQVLGARPDGVAPDVPFSNLGFDSLMAVELRGRLEAALGLRLSATLVYAHPTADALAGQLLTRLAPAGPPAPDPAPAARPDRGPDPGPDGGPHDGDLSDLDTAEVAALLAAELDAFATEQG